MHRFNSRTVISCQLGIRDYKISLTVITYRDLDIVYNLIIRHPVRSASVRWIRIPFLLDIIGECLGRRIIIIYITCLCRIKLSFSLKLKRLEIERSAIITPNSGFLGYVGTLYFLTCRIVKNCLPNTVIFLLKLPSGYSLGAVKINLTVSFVFVLEPCLIHFGTIIGINGKIYIIFLIYFFLDRNMNRLNVTVICITVKNINRLAADLLLLGILRYQFLDRIGKYLAVFAIKIGQFIFQTLCKERYARFIVIGCINYGITIQKFKCKLMCCQLLSNELLVSAQLGISVWCVYKPDVNRLIFAHHCCKALVRIYYKFT